MDPKTNSKFDYLLLISLLIVNVAILLASFTWLANISKELNIFIGIGQLVVMVGIILYAFYSTRLWFLCYTASQKMREKEKDDQFRLNLQKELNRDAEKRREFERERNKENDLFRLIELAKEKPKEVLDKTKTKEKGDAFKITENDCHTKEAEGVNTDKLDKLMNYYQTLIASQQTQTP